MKKLGTFYGNHSQQSESVSQISPGHPAKGKRLQTISLQKQTQTACFIG
jgi:hypothetical protein